MAVRLALLAGKAETMPTIRTPISRAARPRITAEAKAILARAVVLDVTYSRCIRGDECLSTVPIGTAPPVPNFSS